MNFNFSQTFTTTLFVAFTTLASIAIADLELTFSPDGTPAEFCVSPGQTVEVPVFLVQTGTPTPGGDLNVDGIVSMGVQLEFNSDEGSTTVVSVNQESSFVELLLVEIENTDGQAAFAGAIGFTESPLTGSSILLGTFTFQPGDMGNATLVTATLPDILPIQGPFVISGSNPPVVLDSMIGNSIATAIVTSSFELGDVNRDGSINLLDIAPFVDLISSGMFQCEADLNSDGLVNLLDVGPFVDVLSN